MANTTLPTNLDVDIWAETASEPEFKLSPDSTKYSEGWIVELARVDYENYVQGRQDQAIANMVENGVPHWEGTITYQQQSTARSPIDNYAYICINNNVVGGSDPSVDISGNWVRQDNFTTDSIANNIQTFADSSLQNVNFNTTTLVLNKDGSNLDTTSDPSLIANRDFTNVTGETVLTKLSSSNAATLSVVNDKVNINVPTVRSVAHDYTSAASDADNLILTAVPSQETPTHYFTEMTITFRYPTTFTQNTGPVFINLNNIGVVELTDLIGTSLTAGALLADDHLECIYNGATDKFFIRSNFSDQGGIYGSFIEYNISVSNSISGTTATQLIDLSGTPIEHAKTIVVKNSINTNLTNNGGVFAAGVRISTAPTMIVSEATNKDPDNVVSHIMQIDVTRDILELFATNPTFTIGAGITTAEVLGGYR